MNATPASSPRDNSPLPEDTSPQERPVRSGTVVYGMVLAVIGALLLVVQLTDIVLDPTLVVLGVCLGAGLCLLAWGIVRALGSERQR